MLIAIILQLFSIWAFISNSGRRDRDRENTGWRRRWCIFSRIYFCPTVGNSGLRFRCVYKCTKQRVKFHGSWIVTRLPPKCHCASHLTTSEMRQSNGNFNSPLPLSLSVILFRSHSVTASFRFNSIQFFGGRKEILISQFNEFRWGKEELAQKRRLMISRYLERCEPRDL